MPEASDAAVTRYEVRGSAAWITLDRPEQRNALSAALVDQLAGHLDAAIADAAVRCIVLTGNGSAFCAGADLKSPPGQVIDGRQGATLADVLARMLDAPKPVISAVNGAAFAGGLGLVGASDIVVSVDDAPFSFSEVRIGVIPAVISVVCLPKLGVHHGMRLLLTGQRFDGRDAVRYGLVHRAVPAADLIAAVQRGNRRDRRRRADRRRRMQEAGAPRADLAARRGLSRNQRMERPAVPQRRGCRRHGRVSRKAQAVVGPGMIRQR